MENPYKLWIPTKIYEKMYGKYFCLNLNVFTSVTANLKFFKLDTASFDYKFDTH